ncbi:hypothetical protein EC973_003578 [Apophysomyces ossiformis]|uniref:GAF domain-containing protein n=1 Tax=Apophysomyces ossiformis TaxID=679940 RepID=A0A8H7ES56_9FUNG|nr:hypothetical protein EC973_003578 [Apophysomyces ossiformis]
MQAFIALKATWQNVRIKILHTTAKSAFVSKLPTRIIVVLDSYSNIISVGESSNEDQKMKDVPALSDSNVSKEAFYELLRDQIKAIVEDQTFWVTNLSNASAVIYHGLQSLEQFQKKPINWAGFYVTDPKEPNKLILGPFQGKIACTEIPFGKGVCGKAAQTMETQIVKDVHAFPGHIACDAASRSEIVVPLVVEGVIGVLDIDCEEPEGFSEEDRVGLEAVAKVIIESCVCLVLPSNPIKCIDEAKCESIQEEENVLRSLNIINQEAITDVSTITVGSTDEAEEEEDDENDDDDDDNYDDDDDAPIETFVRKVNSDESATGEDVILEQCLDTLGLSIMDEGGKKNSLKRRLRKVLKISTRASTPPTPPLTPCRSPSTPFPSQGRPTCTEQKYQTMTPVPLAKTYRNGTTAYSPQLNTKTICANNDEWIASSSISSCSSTLSAASFSTTADSCVSYATSHTAAYNTCPLPSVASSPPPLITPDIQPRPSCSSRFISAFQKFTSKKSSSISAKKNSNNALSDALQSRPAVKPMPTKSSTFTNKLKSTRMTRSLSSSSLVPNWSRRGKDTRRKSTANSAYSGRSKKPTKSILKHPQPLKHRNGSSDDLLPLFHVQQEQRLRIAQYKKKSISFAKVAAVCETYSKQDYDRSSDPDAVCTRLTAAMAQRIKEELNQYKLQEMQVHQQSRVNTHFFL